jgi:rRNA maturation protein Nop10
VFKLRWRLLNDRCKACGRKFRRSNPANARLWLLYHTLSEKLPVKGQTFSAETWHAYFKTRYLGADDVTLPSGKVLTIPKSTANLDTAEFNDYQTQVEAWANEHDVYLDEMPA